MNQEQQDMREYNGVAASPGIAIGHAFIYNEANFWVEEKNIPSERIETEKERFMHAVAEVIKDIRDLKHKLEQRVGKEEASIFDPHIMLLEDPAVVKETFEIIEEGKNAEFAFFRTTRKIIKVYKKLEDAYLRQRTDDITDILRRVHTKLQGKEFSVFTRLKHPVIVVAPSLSPSDTAHMHTGNVMAFVTDLGGLTSHATIIARSLGIPAVLGVKTVSTEVGPGETLIVDGMLGRVIVNPDDELLAEYRDKQREYENVRESLSVLKDLPAITPDQHPVHLLANIEFPEEVPAVTQNGATGVGLYRSEYHFLRDDRMPTEDELFEDYDRVAETLAPLPVTIRTFDLGGDKISHLIQTEPEENPFLGWRAIRVSLALKDLFKVHLKAILRASSRGNLKIMFPMISSMEELDEALICIEQAKQDLRNEGHAFDEDIPVGIMIEIPSAVMVAEQLAEKAAFFSIGTNDLIQYAVAVDRTNDRIANLFEPFHPGVLRLIRMTIDAGHAHGIPVAVCGEISNDPAAALLLLGMGIDELSMAPSFVPVVKRIIRETSHEQARRLAGEITGLSSAQAVKARMSEFFEQSNIDISLS